MIFKTRDKEYFKQYLSKLSFQEYLALSEAILDHVETINTMTGQINRIKRSKVTLDDPSCR